MFFKLFELENKYLKIKINENVNYLVKYYKILQSISITFIKKKSAVIK